MMTTNEGDIFRTGSLKKEFVINPNTCSGCKLCELICSIRKKGFCNPKKANIKIIRNLKYKLYIPVFTSSCDFCEGEPACMNICPTKSISYINEETAILKIGKEITMLPALIIRGD